ncbi:hypothetical protein V3331_04785 [Gaopeijia maritima]|uniref:hypothetical protein n=1 Tax=Gaopeijia maritima TaxID=3119007 RepID=UPI0032457EA7
MRPQFLPPVLISALTLGFVGCTDSPTDTGPRLQLSPSSARIDVGEELSISASLMGLDDTAVTWSSDCGILQPTGTLAVLTARWAPTECTVTATSVAEPTVSGSAQIVIEPVLASANLLAPGTFDASIAPFTPDDDNPDYVEWSPEDARGATTSGAARITHPFAGDGGTFVVMDYCFVPEPGAVYRLGGQARLTESRSGAQVLVSARVFSHDCVLFESYLGHGTFASGSTEWDAGAFTFSAPASGAEPIRITVGINKLEGVASEVSALVDDLFLVRVN